MDARAAVAALLDPDRLAVAGLLVDEWRTVDEVVELTGRPRRRVLDALGTLRQAGLAAEDGGRFTIGADVLRRLGRATATTVAPMHPRIGYGMTDEEREVLARFFADTRLVEVPATRTKRLIVLQRLALEFDVGRHYAEAEVNGILAGFHDDTATLRRYLVDEEFLDRDAGEYWRSGGRVDVA